MAVKILNLDLVIISLVTSVIYQNSDHLHTLQCNSLPSFDNTDFYIYFGCSCDSSQTPGGTFSISRFAYNLTQRISEKSLVIPLTDGIQIKALLMGGGIECPPSKNLENEATESCEGSK